MLWAAVVGLGFRGEVQIQNLTITDFSIPVCRGRGEIPSKSFVLPGTVANLVDAELPVLKSAQNYPSISVQCKIYVYLYIFLKPRFCLTESRLSGKALLRVGGMLCRGNSKGRGYMCSFFFPSVCRVLPWRANWVLSRRYSSLVWWHESIASNHLPSRAAAVKQDVW